MAVVPFVLNSFGSRITFSEFRFVSEPSVMSTGCCAGGLNFKRKNCPRRQFIEK
jgi:hypothetical protein